VAGWLGGWLALLRFSSHAKEKRNPARAAQHKYLNLINFIYQSPAAAGRAIKLQG